MTQEGAGEDSGVVRVVGLLGGECTGKSTLAAELAQSLPAVVAREALRTLVQHHGRPPTASEQADVLAAQVDAVQAAVDLAAADGVPWVVADPSPLMTAVYSIVYFDDDALMPVALDALDGTEVLLWLADDIPWVAEPGMRDGEEFRRAAQVVIGEVVVPALAARRIDIQRHRRGQGWPIR